MRRSRSCRSVEPAKSSRWTQIMESLGFGGGKKGLAQAKSRGLRLEPLEERQLLAVLVWDPDGNAANGFGGSGDWTGGSYWYNQTSETYVEWNNANNDEAVFQGSVGTVTVNSAVSAAKVTFQDTDGYTISGSNALTLTGTGETITANQSATISTAIVASTNQQWTVASGKTLSIGGNVDLASHSLTVGGAGDTDVAGVISGTGGSLTKAGAGTLTLSGTNTYTGGTTINQGMVSFANGGLGASGAIAIAGNSIIQWSSSNTQDISGRLSIQASTNATLDVGQNTLTFAAAISNALSNPGSLTKAGSGTLSLIGSDRFGGVTISDGTLEVRGVSISTLSYGDISNNGALVFNSANNLNIGGAISGTGSVTQQGTGTLIFTGTNTYSGGTTINAGTLLVGAMGTAATSYTLSAQLSAGVSGEIVTFIDDTASTIIGSAVTNASGIATITYVLTENAIPGTHTIRATCGALSLTGTLSLTSASLSEWLYRKQITISNTNVDSDLTDFPLYVKISNDSEIGSAALANGYDIRFTASDGTTLLNYERESWSGGGGSAASGNFWVKVPTINGATDTTIYVYYGKANAADGQNSSAVWDTNYKGVWHFGTSSTLSTEDSTSTGNDGVNYGATATTGEIGGAAYFNGTNIVTSANTNISGAQARTIEAWVRYDTLTNSFSAPVSIGSNSALHRFSLAKETSTYSNKFAVWVYRTAPDVDGVTSPSVDTWYHLVATYDGTAVKLYVNGIQEASANLTLNTTNSTMSIGDSYSSMNLVDETRISNVARSAAWTKFEYYNIASSTSELSWSSEQSNQGVGVYSLAVTPTTIAATTNAIVTAQLSSNVAGRVVTFVDVTTSTTIGTAITNTSGIASITYGVPASAVTGAHTIRATYGTSSQTGTLNVTSASISEWLYRKQITISHANVDSDLTDFPLYVKISNDSEIGSAALANGYDIRFTASDGTTLLNYERESWSGGGGSAASGNFWVKVPTINGATDTTIYVYYGKANAADGQNSSAVWDTNYKGVWHFGTSSTLSTEDSTSTGNDGVNYGATATTGEIGGAAYFNGTNIVTSANTNISGAQARTIEAWVRYDTLTNSFSAPVSIGSNSALHRFSLAKETSTYSNKFAVWVYRTAPDVDGVTSPSVDTWYHLVATYDGTAVKLYVNGIQEASANLTLNTTNSTMSIGDSYSSMNLVDETRISNVARSAAWTKFEYYNIASSTSELSWSSQESYYTGQNTSVSSVTVAPMPAAAGMTVTLTAQLSSTLSGETITFTDDTGSTVIGDAVTDSLGIASISFTIPVNATGSYTLRATYGNSSCAITMNLSSLSVRSLTIIPVLTNAGTLGSGSVTNNAGLMFNRSDVVTVNNVINGTGIVAQRGTGTLILVGANGYSGGTTINGGTLQLGNSAALGDADGSVMLTTGVLDLYGNSVAIGSLSGTGGTITDSGVTAGTSILTVNESTNTTYAGILQDGGTRQVALTKEGVGTLTLSGVSTHVGGTTVEAGTLQLGGSNALGGSTGGLTVNAGTVDLHGYNTTVGSLNGTGGVITDNALDSGTTTLNVNSASGTSSYAGILQDGASRTVALAKGGASTLVLTGANTYSAGTTLNGGTLGFVNDALGAGTVVFAGGTLQWASGNTQDISGRIAVIASGKSAIFDTNGNDIVFNNTLSGTGSLTKTGSGVLTLVGVNSYTGGTTINAGTLRLGDETTNGSVTGNIADNAALIFANSSALTYSGVISGSGSVTKNGLGTLTLSGIHTYGGGTTLNSGIVNLMGTLTNTGRTLDLGDGTGVWNMNGGTILGGVVTASGGSGLRIAGSSSSTLDGVTLNTDVIATSAGTFSLIVKNGLVLNGTMTLPTGGTGNTTFLGSQSLTGTGEIVLTDSVHTLTVKGTSSTLPATLLVGAGITIRGVGTISGYYTGDNLDNQGTIWGDVANLTLAVSVLLNNSGTLKASGSGRLTASNLQGNSGAIQAGTDASDTGTLTLGGAWTSSGSLVVNGGTLTLGGTWSNSAGSVNVNGGTLYLGGSFNTAGLGTFQYTAGTVNLTGTLTNTGSTLSLGSGTGVWNLRGGKIVGGTVDASSGTWLQVATSGTLDGATVNADIASLASSTLTVKNGLTLNSVITLPNSSSGAAVVFVGSQNLTGTGQIVLQYSSADTIQVKGTSDTTPATLTVGSGITIRGKGIIDGYYANDMLVNQGTIAADAAGGSLSLNLNWSNTNGILAVNGGILNLGATFTTADIGTINHAAGTLNQTGTLDNTGATLNLGANTGVWNLSGATIIGGVVAATGGPWLRLTVDSTMDGVELDADMTLLGAGSLTVKNGLALNGIVTVSSTYNWNVCFWGTQNLTGTGQIITTVSNNVVYVRGTSTANHATLTVGAGITIRGLGTLYATYSGDNWINQGTILADVNGETLTIDALISNSGTLSTSGGGSLTVSNLSTNSGTVQAGTSATDTGTLTLGGVWTSSGSLVVNGGTLTLGGTWANDAGSFAVNGGTLNLGGSFTTAGIGTFQYTAGTVNLTGTLTNTSDTLTLGSSTGVWNFRSGKIVGGTIDASSGTWLRVVSSGTLNGTTVNADIASLADSTLNIRNGLTLNSIITMPSSAGATLLFLGTQSLTGTGQIILGNSYDLVQVKGTSDTVSAILTIGSGVTIQGKGSINGYYAGDALINEGTILATGNALTLGGNWSNVNGTLAITSGTLNLGGSFTTAGLGTFQYTAGTVNLTGILNNTDDTLTLDSSTGVWNLNDGTIIGGVVAAGSGIWLRVGGYGGTLDGVTLNADITCLSGGAADLDIRNGLTLNGILTLCNSKVRFNGSQSLNGTGQIFLPMSDCALQVVGASSATHATLTVGAGITIHGIGTIVGAYSGDSLINEGIIQADSIQWGSWVPTISVLLTNHGTIRTCGTEKLTVTHLQSNTGTIQAGTCASDSGTLTLGGTWTNTGTLMAIGNAVLNTGTLSISGRVVPVSGTELRLDWGSFHTGTTYSIELSADGVEYTSIGTVTADDNTIVTYGMQPNTPYNVRIVVTDANGGKEVYDGGAVSTKDEADTSGWYQVTSITLDSDGSELTSGTNGTNFTLNDTSIYAGSQQSTALLSINGLVNDGSTPTLASDGSIKLYQVLQYGCGSLAAASSDSLVSAMASASSTPYTYEPDLYQNSFSVTFDFIAHTVNGIADAIGKAIAGAIGWTTDPIRYFDGTVDYSATDIKSDDTDRGLSLSRSWTNNTQWSASQHNGYGWVNDSMPMIQQYRKGSTIVVLDSAIDSTTFHLVNGQYVPTTYVADTLVHDTTNHEFVWADAQGNQYHFYDFSSSVPAGRLGTFKSKTDAAGIRTYVSEWTSAGDLREIRRQDADGNDIETLHFLYSDGLIYNVQLRRSNGQGGWTILQQVDYEYYGSSESYGNLDDLKTATTRDGDGNVLDTQYYRYYTPSESVQSVYVRSLRGWYLVEQGDPEADEDSTNFAHGLKFVFDSASYSRLDAAVGDPLTATDTQVAPYAQQYFEYDKWHRCKVHKIQGTGDSTTGGIGTFTYKYSINPAYKSKNPTNNNTWRYKTVETLPDGNKNIVYCNKLGEVMLKVFRDINDVANPTLSGSQWLYYYQYDTMGNVTLEAEPSAVASYSVDTSTYVLTVNLSTDSGLIHLTDYYSSTTATATTAGGVKGYVQDTKIKQGSSGTAVLQETKTYFRKTYGGSVNIVLASDTVYRNTNGTGAQTTNYAYTWYTNTVGVQSVTQTSPIVTTAQNGSGAANTAVVYYDRYGRATWIKDADGYITYYEYDIVTGAVTKQITDVDTTQTSYFTSLPTGWTTPTGGGSHLITTRQVDALGRTTKETDPDGNVTYIVYKDIYATVITYAGWNATTHLTTGPITVYREDPIRNYTETLTYTWNDANGLPVDSEGCPTGVEWFIRDSRFVIQSLTRTLMNSAGQKTAVRKYFDFTGLTYSTTKNIGTEGVNYLETDISYGIWGQSVTTIDPSGTVSKKRYDSLGRLTRVLVGLNSWSLVAVADYVYDGNDVGDGNLTQTTVHPGSGQADRVTQWAYDWRDRQIASKEGVQSSEDSTTNRPITYYVLDNLGQVVEIDTYDADGISLASLGSTNGVPNAPSASLRRSQTTAAYDSLGRIYQSSVKTVDQSSGAILSTETTDYWYSRRGQLIKTESPTGSVTKYQYDGAGRRVLTATTDGGGDTTWNDATNLTGDTVITHQHYAYDDAGNQTSTTDALDRTTSYVYDNLNRLTSQTDANNAVTTYAYNVAGRLLSLTDSENNTTTWYYDMLGRCVRETNALNDNEYYVYDAMGRLTRKTDYNDRVTTYSYNYLGYLTGENWLDAQQNVIRTFAYTYDLVGDLLTASDPAADYDYAYDVLGRLTTVTQDIAGLTPTVVFNQSYDADSDRTALSASIDGTADFTNAYAYDGLGQMTQVMQSGVTGGNAVAEKRVDFAYNADGQFNTITRYANLTGTQLVATGTYDYDLAGRLTSLTYTKGQTTLVDHDWTYNSVNEITDYINSIDGTADYTSDDTSQLTGADYDYQTDESYTYDDNGNRTNTGYVTGTNNLLLSDGTYRYAYDDNGNRTSKFVDADADGVLDSGDTDVTTYTWDYRNRLTEVSAFDDYAAYSSDTPDQVVAYAYDYANRLVERSLDTDGDGTVDSSSVYVYDGNQIALQFDVSGTGSASASDLSHRYLWGPAVDQLLADERVESLGTAGDVVWPLTDNLGTVRDLATYDSNTDVTTIANHRVYDAYGNRTSQTNSAVDCLFGYTARQYDEATGLQNNLNRWYDAKVGRWTSEDPIGFWGGDTNLYGYIGNGATNATDPTGLYYWDINLSVGWIIGITGGVMIDDTGWHPYIGGGLQTPGASGSVTFSPMNISPGLNGGIQATLPGLAGQFTYSRCGGASLEGGVGIGAGVSGSLYWVF